MFIEIIPVFWLLIIVTGTLYGIALLYRDFKLTKYVALIAGSILGLLFADIGVIRSLPHYRNLPYREVVTFCFHNTDDRAYRVREYWKQLEQLGCDIVALQEVWPLAKGVLMVPGSNTNVEMLPLPEQTSYKYRVGVAEYLVVSRYPVNEVYKTKYEGFYVVNITLPSSKIVLVNVHLWNPLFRAHTANGKRYRPDILRKKQIEELFGFLNSYQLLDNVIIGGDFNTQIYSPLLWQKIVNHGFSKAGSSIWVPTFATTLPGIALDHVFYRGIEIIDYEIEYLPFSDHTLLKVKVGIVQ